MVQICKLLLLIILLFYFSGCFTIDVVQKTKNDRKKEVVRDIISVSKDSAGVIAILFTKKGKKGYHSIQLPLDSLIEKYRKSKSVFLKEDNPNSILKGIFYTENIYNEKGFQRLILLRTDAIVQNVPGTKIRSRQISYSGIQPYKEKINLPFDYYPAFSSNITKTACISFIHTTNYRFSESLFRKEIYVIAFEPKRKKYTRLLLLPFYAGLDVLTSPFQLIGLGLIWLYDMERKKAN